MKFWTISAAIGALALTFPAAAHEVWVERAGDGLARIYLGEPNEAVPPAGDPEFHRLKAPDVTQGSLSNIALVRRANHLEAALPGKGDVRVRDETIFAPWKIQDGMEGGIFYARAGRTETAGALDLEFVPVAAGSDNVVLRFRGQPVADAAVTVISPALWEKRLTTNANGEVTVPGAGAGRYLLSASHKEKAARNFGGTPVTSVLHVTTLTFER